MHYITHRLYVPAEIAAVMVKCLERDSNPHSADQKHPSSSPFYFNLNASRHTHKDGWQLQGVGYNYFIPEAVATYC